MLCVSMYLLSVFLLLNFSNMVIFWSMLEVSMVMFICSSSLSSGKQAGQGNYNLLVYYFVMQAMVSLVLLFSLALQHQFMYFKLLNFLTFSCLFFKLGLFPFHFWVYKFVKICEPLGSFFLLFTQKVPFFIFMFSLDWDFLFTSLLFSSIFGSLFLFNSFSISDLLVSSSIYMIFWVMFCFNSSISFFFLMLLFYMIFVNELCLLKNLNSFEQLPFFLSLIFVSLFFLSLPPFSLFFFKFFMMSNLCFLFSSETLLMIWVLTFLSTLGYFKFFYKFFFCMYMPKFMPTYNWVLILSAVTFLFLTIL